MAVDVLERLEGIKNIKKKRNKKRSRKRTFLYVLLTHCVLVILSE